MDNSGLMPRNGRREDEVGFYPVQRALSPHRTGAEAVACSLRDVASISIDSSTIVRNVTLIRAWEAY